ncbi:MAG: NAD(P)-dependent oxidoreductase [Alphaproteobacteria bacterium]|nr:NAD(P)-dependent oxidoreductase [Alphaproteobacteria bacterium]
MAGQKPSIGFIGLGLMGSAMVQRLLDLNYPMTVLANRSRTNVEAALARGAKEAATAKELAQNADIIMLCVDTSASVEARMGGDDGVIAGLTPGKLVIDFGTSLPGSTLEIGARIEAAECVYMDAPLAKTPDEGRTGHLTIMAAGRPEHFERARPVLDDLGAIIFHVGPLGAGHTLKLINNFFAMTSACAMSEAFAMADKAGLERQMLYDVMSAGALKSGMMTYIKNYAIDHRIELAFSIANGGKDVGYFTRMAEQFGRRSDVAAGTAAALTQAKAEGWGDRLIPEMVDFFAGKKP